MRPSVALGSPGIFTDCLSPRIVLGSQRRDCPSEMQSPAMNSQGFTGLPLPWLRHVTVTHAGLLLPASGLCCRQVSSIALPSVHDFTLRLTLPFGDSGGATRVTPSVVCHDSPVRDNPQNPFEGGRRRFASGTPATWGAHNSETSMQQPDHQSLVRESNSTRITVALSVDTFHRSLSSRIGNLIPICLLHVYVA